jgi:hypothetical protein
VVTLVALLAQVVGEAAQGVDPVRGMRRCDECAPPGLLHDQAFLLERL